MRRIRRLTKRHSLVLFFLLSYVLSWGIWGLEDRLPVQTVESWLGSFGPAFAAILVVGVNEGRRGLTDLVSRLFLWRVGIRWYLVALLLIPAVGLVMAVIVVLAGGLTSALPDAAYWRSTAGHHLLVWAAGTLIGAVVAWGEELGWRGFALPRLQIQGPPLVASLILGTVWGLWHFNGLVRGSAARYGTLDIPLFVGGTISVSVIYTWLYNNTRGSVLIACLFHAAYDVTVVWVSAVVPLPPGATRWGLVGLGAIALGIILLAGPRLSCPGTARLGDRPE
jgi:membrane protease YdiL (CAAX protease family)